LVAGKSDLAHSASRDVSRNLCSVVLLASDNAIHVINMQTAALEAVIK
jgi:hypothetical protein